MSKMCEMSNDVIVAYQMLQDKLEKAEIYGGSSYKRERIEQAMVSLLNSPSKVGEPAKLVNCAMGDSGKKLRNRIVILMKAVENGELLIENLSSEEKYNALRFEFEDELKQTELDEKTKSILQALSCGVSPENLADRTGIPLPRMRTQITRSRDKFRKLREKAI